MKKEEKAKDPVIEECIDSILAYLEEEYHSELESFDAFAAKTRAKLRKSLTQYRSRLVNGYDALLEELSKEPGKSDEAYLPGLLRP